MAKMVNNLFQMRTGRKLEVREYGDDAGHPAFFFHGLIGSQYQAAYIADQAREHGLRIIAPNRPGVGASEFIKRASRILSIPYKRANTGVYTGRTSGKHLRRTEKRPTVRRTDH